MSEIKYSFIIPHKNYPELLTRCVDSIPEREDIQIVVVDDNSDADKKPQIERQGLEIILLDAEHSKGAGRARNVGLEHAKGKWLLFADADDYYTDYLPTLLDKYADDEITDIVYLNACKFDENGIITPHITNKLITDYLANVSDSELKLRFSVWTPWSRMVKRKIVEDNHLQFDELPAGNDKMFCLFCSRYAAKMTVENNQIYWYYKPSKGSQTDKNRNYLMIDGLLDVRCRTIALYKEVGYKPIPTLFELLFKSSYSKGLNQSEKLKKYLFFIRKSGLYIWSDLLRYFLQHIFTSDNENSCSR